MAEKNMLGRLNEYLFDELERLGDPELSGDDLKAEIERSRAMTGVADKVIGSANSMVRVVQLKAEYGRQMPSIPNELGAGE